VRVRAVRDLTSGVFSQIKVVLGVSAKQTPRG
jgi:hypothetical protein